MHIGSKNMPDDGRTLIHPAAVQTTLKTQIKTEISQQATIAAAAQLHPLRATRLLNMTLMNPDS
jgi:hypothetical protein